MRRDDAPTGPPPLVALGEAGESLELEAYREFVRLAEAGRPAALVTVIGTTGSAPRGLGAAMAVREDGSILGTVGGGGLEQELIGHALDALADGRPRRFHYDYTGGARQNLDKACAGTTDFFIQPSVRRPDLLVFGAGHIAIALAPIAQGAGFRVIVVDDRPGYPDPERFPAGVQLVGAPMVPYTESFAFDASTSVVIVTYGHEQDQEVLAACLHRPWRYLGMIGSRAKAARVFAALGTDEAARRRLESVRSPIGLDLGGRSPGEIAVAIAAELLAVRHGRGGTRAHRDGKEREMRTPPPGGAREQAEAGLAERPSGIERQR